MNCPKCDMPMLELDHTFYCMHCDLELKKSIVREFNETDFAVMLTDRKDE